MTTPTRTIDLQTFLTALVDGDRATLDRLIPPAKVVQVAPPEPTERIDPDAASVVHLSERRTR